MKLSELVYQGSGSQKKVEKFLFGDNYNLIDTAKVQVPDTVRQILRLSLYPAMKAKGEGGLKDGRIGATFTHLNDTYRFVRDLEKDACSLSRYNGEKKDFEEISRNPSFIQKAFEETFKLSAGTYERLFVLDEELTRKWSKDFRSGKDGYFDTLDDGGVKDKIRKLKSLEEERKTIELMKEYEFELDGLQNRLFEVTDRIQKIKNKEDEIPFVTNELDSFKEFESLEGFPKDIEKRLREYDRQEEKKACELLDLDNKMSDLVNKLASLKIEPVNKDRALIAFSAGALISFGLAVFLKRFLAFSLAGFIVFMLLSAWRLILYFKRKDEEVRLNAETRSLTESKNLIEKRFEIETSIVKKFLAKTKSESASDALDSMKRRAQIVTNLENAKKECEELKKDLKFEESLKEQEDLKKRIRLTEEKLRSFPSVSMEPNDLESEIERLRDEVGDHAFDPSVAAHSDPYASLLDDAALMLKVDREKISRSLKESYTANLKILSGGYFSGVEWQGAALKSFGITGGINKGLNDLDEDEHCIAFLSLQFTLLQMFSRFPRPVLAFGCFDSAKLKVGKERIMQALAHLAKSFQIIHVTRPGT